MRGVELALLEPLGPRRVPVEHGLPLLEPVELLGPASPTRPRSPSRPRRRSTGRRSSPASTNSSGGGRSAPRRAAVPRGPRVPRLRPPSATSPVPAAAAASRLGTKATGCWSSEDGRRQARREAVEIRVGCRRATCANAPGRYMIAGRTRCAIRCSFCRAVPARVSGRAGREHTRGRRAEADHGRAEPARLQRHRGGGQGEGEVRAHAQRELQAPAAGGCRDASPALGRWRLRWADRGRRLRHTRARRRQGRRGARLRRGRRRLRTRCQPGSQVAARREPLRAGARRGSNWCRRVRARALTTAARGGPRRPRPRRHPEPARHRRRRRPRSRQGRPLAPRARSAECAARPVRPRLEPRRSAARVHGERQRGLERCADRRRATAFRVHVGWLAEHRGPTGRLHRARLRRHSESVTTAAARRRSALLLVRWNRAA